MRPVCGYFSSSDNDSLIVHTGFSSDSSEGGAANREEWEYEPNPYLSVGQARQMFRELYRFGYATRGGQLCHCVVFCGFDCGSTRLTQ